MPRPGPDFRTVNSRPRSSSAQLAESGEGDPAVNWMRDAYECVATCCCTDVAAYVMDRLQHRQA